MIDPKLLRTDPEAVARNLARRGFTLDVSAFKALEEKRKPWAVELDRLRAERNQQDHVHSPPSFFFRFRASASPILISRPRGTGR